MDPTKKRKLDENGLTATTTLIETQTQTLTQSDALKILEPFTSDQLRQTLSTLLLSHPDTTLPSVRVIADRDVSQRKLFIRGLGWETTSDSLRSVFQQHGPLEEAVVILDKQTSKSKGYGFVTYKHIDGAILALKQSSKQIDGRIAVAALASAGLTGGGVASVGGGGGGGGGGDVSLRKVYVGNVGQDMAGERLLSVFSSFGEIEEGPLGFDKVSGKSKGFALFVYKTVEGANNALFEPMKFVDGRQLVCKLASDGKKGKAAGGGGGGGGGGGVGPNGEGMGMGMAPNSGQYGPGPGGYSSYSGYSGMGQHPNSQQMNPSYNQSVGGQGPGGYGGNAGYGSGGGYGNGGGYGGGGSQYSSGPNSSGYGGYGAAPGGGSGYGGGGSGGAARGGYGMPLNSGGGGYSDGGPYGMSSGGYPGQPHQPTGTSPVPRIPPGGAGGYPNPPPYY